MSDGSSSQPLPALALAGAALPATAQEAQLAPAPSDASGTEPMTSDASSDPSQLVPPPVPPPRVLSNPLPIVAIVLSSLALAVSGLVLALLLVLGGLVYFSGDAPYAVGDPVGGYSTVYTPGIVTDASGTVVTGVGTFDRPATLGEHTLSWPTLSGGTVAVTVTEVDWEADAAVAPSSSPASQGMGYVLATVDLAYTGPGGLVPADDLYLCLESMTWISCDMDVAVETAAPLRSIGVLTDGDTATAIVALELAEGERGSAVLSVETIDGEPLYLAER